MFWNMQLCDNFLKHVGIDILDWNGIWLSKGQAASCNVSIEEIWHKWRWKNFARWMEQVVGWKIKGGVISEGVFTLVPSLKKLTKSLSLNFLK